MEWKNVKKASLCYICLKHPHKKNALANNFWRVSADSKVTKNKSQSEISGISSTGKCISKHKVNDFL